MQTKRRKINFQKELCFVMAFMMMIGIFLGANPIAVHAIEPVTAASFVGNHMTSNLDINANGLSMTVAPTAGYHFSTGAAITTEIKNTVIDSMTFDYAYGYINQNTGAVTKASKTNLTNLQGIAKAYFAKTKVTDLGFDAATIDYLRTINAAQAENYKIFSTYGGEEYLNDFGRFLGLGKAIQNELKANGTVSFNANGNLVISCNSSGYLKSFNNLIRIVNGGMPFVFGDLPVTLTVPANLVTEGVAVKTSNTFDIEEIKTHNEIWQYVDASHAGEPGVKAITAKYDASTSRPVYSPAYPQTYYIKRVSGDVLTEVDVRSGGTMGPNGTGNKLIKVVVDGRTGPTWWAFIKWMDPKFVTFAFRTTKDNVTYNTTTNSYTPADDSQWLKIENELLMGGPLDSAHSSYGYNGFCETNKYLFNSSGDWRLDEYNAHEMWYMYEVPKVVDYDITVDQIIYVNQLMGMTGGSGGGGGNPQGTPFWGMDGRASFTIKQVAN